MSLKFLDENGEFIGGESHRVRMNDNWNKCFARIEMIETSISDFLLVDINSSNFR
jgi:hypothetical protein